MSRFKTLRFALSALIFVMLPISLFSQVNYYVDPSGTDDASHGGSPGTGAWQTIEYAVNNVSDPTTATIIINVSDDTFTLNSNDVDINRSFTDLTIRGAGAKSTIVQAEATAGSASDRVFYISGSDETVLLESLAIRYGKSGGDGGGIINLSGNLTLNKCSINDNTSSQRGGGLFTNNGQVIFINCTINGNAADQGAGVHNYAGVLTMTNCTISDNVAQIDYGGGLYTAHDAATITNCTFANNSAQSLGGGIYLLSNNLHIKNTLIVNNNSVNSTADDFNNASGTVYNNGYNIVETQNGSDFTDGVNGCIVGAGTYNLSTVLEDNNTVNGSQTLKTTSGSAAINGGEGTTANNGVSIPTQDQRGAERNGTVDIGAYEYYNDDAALPVELLSFRAISANNQVTLNWTTESETNNLGFILTRSRTRDGEYFEISGYTDNPDLKGAGNSSIQHQYSYTDRNVFNGHTYWYKLLDVDIRGVMSEHGPISATPNTSNADILLTDGSELPERFALLPNYPNPFNPMTTIQFDVPKANIEFTNISLKIHNALGRHVRTLFSGPIAPGRYKLIWDGTNRNGSLLPSGIYFCTMSTKHFTVSRKMILMK